MERGEKSGRVVSGETLRGLSHLGRVALQGRLLLLSCQICLSACLSATRLQFCLSATHTPSERSFLILCPPVAGTYKLTRRNSSQIGEAWVLMGEKKKKKKLTGLLWFRIMSGLGLRAFPPSRHQGPAGVWRGQSVCCRRRGSEGVGGGGGCGDSWRCPAHSLHVSHLPTPVFSSYSFTHSTRPVILQGPC